MVKSKLDLDPGLKNENTLTYVLRYIDEVKNDPSTEIITSLSKLLNCKPDEITARLEE
jgi:hypothetical protein